MASEKEVCDLIKLMAEKNVNIDELKLLISEAAVYQKKLSDVELYCNSNEQYARNWSIRVFGVDIPKSLIIKHGVDGACMIQVYDRLIYPVLSKKLGYVPDCFNLLSNGHFVGEKKGNQPRTVIIRFVSRYYRNIFLGAKYDYLPKPTSAEVTRGIKYFAAYPDLTARNHAYLMGLKSDPRTKSCWAFDGSLRFVLEDDSSKNVFFIQDIRISPKESIDNAARGRRSRSESPPSKRQTRASSGRARNDQDRPKSQDTDPGRLNQRGKGGQARGNVRGGYGSGLGGRGQGRGGRGHGRGGRDQGRGSLFQGPARGEYHHGAGQRAKQGVVEPPVPSYPEHSGFSQQAGPSGRGQSLIARHKDPDHGILPNDQGPDSERFLS